MALFKGERVYPLAIHFQPRTRGVGENPTDGSEWYDAAQLTKYTVFNGVQASQQALAGVSVTPVTATNPSSTANLMGIALPANSMNVAGKTLHIHGSGVYTCAGTTGSTLTFNVSLGGTTVLTFVSGALTNTASNMPWAIDGYICTKDTGASGTVVSGGRAMITLSTNAAAATTTYENVPAGNTAVNVAAACNVQFTALANIANASYTVTQQFAEVEIGN